METTKPSASDLLRAFASRRSDENTLSDMLCAAMEVSRELLAEVCDACGVGRANPVQFTVSREFAIDVGRPDLVVNMQGAGNLIIEVKLGDTNYHFDQYIDTSDFYRPQFALITNHSPAKSRADEAVQKGWKVLLWSKLLNRLDEVVGLSRVPAVEAFVSYARAVCQRERWSPMKLDPQSLESIVTLRAVLEEIVKDTDISSADCELSKLCDTFGRSWFGVSFSIAHPQKQPLTVNFDVSFAKKEEAFLGLEIVRRDGGNDTQLVTALQKAADGQGELRHGSDRECFWLTMLHGEKEFEIFNQGGIDVQKKELQEFFRHQIDWLIARTTEYYSNQARLDKN